MLSTYFTFSTVSTTVTTDFYPLDFIALSKTETMALLTLWSYGLPSTVQNMVLSDNKKDVFASECSKNWNYVAGPQ